jgi:hypothetical protein
MSELEREAGRRRGEPEFGRDALVGPWAPAGAGRPLATRQRPGAAGRDRRAAPVAAGVDDAGSTEVWARHAATPKP